MPPVSEHRKSAESLIVRFCIVVTSDAVYEGRRRDEVTPAIATAVADTGNILVNAVVVPNDPTRIEAVVKESMSVCDAVIVTGGTGVGPKDVTVDTVRKLCVKDIPGFGELFRYLTYLKHGAVAIASRAFACVAGNSVVFVTPGSRDAVELALTKLVLPEVKHLIYELRGRTCGRSRQARADGGPK